MQDQAGAGPVDLQLTYAEVGRGEDGGTGAGERKRGMPSGRRAREVVGLGSVDVAGRGLEGEGAG